MTQSFEPKLFLQSYLYKLGDKYNGWRVRSTLSLLWVMWGRFFVFSSFKFGQKPLYKTFQISYFLLKIFCGKHTRLYVFSKILVKIFMFLTILPWFYWTQVLDVSSIVISRFKQFFPSRRKRLKDCASNH